MSWNYRIVRDRRGGYGLYEIYSNKQGQPWGMKAVSFVGESREDLIDTMQRALIDAKKHANFDEPEVWPGKAP